MNAENFLGRYSALSTAIVAAGFHKDSPKWIRELTRFVRSGRRRWVIRKGRRAGGSSFLCRFAVAVALWGDWSIGPGDVAVVAFVSVDRDEAAARLRTIAAILRVLGVAFDERADEISLRDRPCCFRVISATTKGVVGFTSILVIGDEMSRWESRDSAANPAAEVMASLRPTMASQPTAVEICCSSPWSQSDYHAELFDKGDDAHQVVTFGATWDFNPTITEEQTRELEPDPRIWSREYAAVPGATLTAALDSEDISACFGRAPRGQKTKHAFIATDASSLRGDAFAWVAGYETDARELVVSEVGAWEGSQLKRVTLGDIAKSLAKKAKSLGVRTIFGDQREEAGLRSLLTREHVFFKSYPWSDTSKDAAVQWLRRSMREGRVCIVDHDPMRKELAGMKARLVPSGRVKYETNGLDYASALVTLAHAACAGDLFAHADMRVALEATARANGGLRTSTSPFEPPLDRGDRTGFRWGNSPGRGFG